MFKFNNYKIISLSLISCLSFSSLSFAAAYYLPEYESKWGGFAGTEAPLFNNSNDTLNKCADAGYTISACPAGSTAKTNERCPYSIDKNYYKKCYTYAELCLKDGYTLTCETGYEPDLSHACPVDSVYVKCQCAACPGYNYSEEEANAEGYIADGEPCLSCGENKYKRKNNPCSGFDYDISNCGVSDCGTLEGETCQSGAVVKYKKCTPCPAPVPSCDSPAVSVENYWCGSALKCWMPQG